MWLIVWQSVISLSHWLLFFRHSIFLAYRPCFWVPLHFILIVFLHKSARKLFTRSTFLHSTVLLFHCKQVKSCSTFKDALCCFFCHSSSQRQLAICLWSLTSHVSISWSKSSIRDQKQTTNGGNIHSQFLYNNLIFYELLKYRCPGRCEFVDCSVHCEFLKA